MSRLNTLFIVVAFICVGSAPALLPGCSAIDSGDPAIIQTDAEVTKLNIEGGCWVLDTGRETYEPTNLSESFKREGLEVSFTARILDDYVSICQVGPIVEIIDIRER